MADFQRLMRNLLYFVVGLLFAAVSIGAYAGEHDYPAVISHWVVDVYSGQYSSPAEACSQKCYSENGETCAYRAVLGDEKTGTNGQKAYQCKNPRTGKWAGVNTRAKYHCPGGGTLRLLSTGPICRDPPPCPEGETRNPETGMCVSEKTPQEQCEDSGGHWGTNHSAGGRFVVQSNCYPNPPRCAQAGAILLVAETLDSRCAPPQQGPCPEGIGDLPYVGNLGGGQCLLGGGAEPEPDPRPEPDQTPSGCGSNQQSGTVQGVPVCINKPPPPPTESSDTKTETKPTVDGGTKETTTTTNTTVDNTTNTTTTTTTVTTVIKDSSGNVTGTTSETSTVVQDSAGYCQENPGAEVCGDGGGEWSGGCDDPGRVMHECKGDPIQCAIAEQTLRTRCALAASDEVVEAFQSMVQFNGTGEGEGLDRREIVVPDALDVSEIGGGVGLVDKSYTIMGRTITVPYSAINTYLDIFGAAMMMIAWIVAFNTIRGAI